MSPCTSKHPGDLPAPDGTKSVKLSIFYPLTDPAVFLANRSAERTFVPRPETADPEDPDDIFGQHELFRIAHVGKAWRAALKSVSSIPHVIFDLSLPSLDKNEPGYQHLHWDWDVPNGGGLLIDGHFVSRLPS